ncbi:NEQ533 [Nanoarchaeum equitans Kin4-M]|uniref:NEQ533 n=1 Tax=Nanoarchaeum equitans (strain Kin4-M) TaxID=228908 RepID=Q74MV7_NANEQ|nr:NEQ533 [Nanoarchaeum equitans Kin4-M]
MIELLLYGLFYILGIFLISFFASHSYSALNYPIEKQIIHTIEILDKLNNNSTVSIRYNNVNVKITCGTNIVYIGNSIIVPSKRLSCDCDKPPYNVEITLKDGQITIKCEPLMKK